MRWEGSDLRKEPMICSELTRRHQGVRWARLTWAAESRMQAPGKIPAQGRVETRLPTHFPPAHWQCYRRDRGAARTGP